MPNFACDEGNVLKVTNDRKCISFTDGLNPLPYDKI